MGVWATGSRGWIITYVPVGVVYSWLSLSSSSPLSIHKGQVLIQEI